MAQHVLTFQGPGADIRESGGADHDFDGHPLREAGLEMPGGGREDAEIPLTESLRIPVDRLGAGAG